MIHTHRLVRAIAETDSENRTVGDDVPPHKIISHRYLSEDININVCIFLWSLNLCLQPGAVRTLVKDNIMLKQILKEFLLIEGVRSVALIARDGFVIESAQNNHSDLEALGALSSSEMRFFSRAGASLNMGSLRQIVLEHRTGAIIFTRITDDEFLAILTDTKAVLGHLTYTLPKMSSRVAAAI